MSAGNRAVWYNKKHPLAIYLDKRKSVNPDIVCDTTKIPKKVGKDFDLIVFDPPHMNCGRKSDLSHYYGHHTTKEILRTIEGSGKEAHRISKPNALMALKWNDHDIKLKRLFDLLPQWEPLFGHLTRNGPTSKSQTYWIMLRRLP